MELILLISAIMVGIMYGSKQVTTATPAAELQRQPEIVVIRQELVPPPAKPLEIKATQKRNTASEPTKATKQERAKVETHKKSEDLKKAEETKKPEEAQMNPAWNRKSELSTKKWE